MLAQLVRLVRLAFQGLSVLLAQRVNPVQTMAPQGQPDQQAQMAPRDPMDRSGQMVLLVPTDQRAQKDLRVRKDRKVRKVRPDHRQVTMMMMMMTTMMMDEGEITTEYCSTSIGSVTLASPNHL